MNLFNRKVYFNSPPKGDIVIFDEAGSRYITEFILDGLPFVIYNMRPERLYISISSIYYFLSSLRFFDWSYVKRIENKLRGLLAALSLHYRLGCFKVMNPKVILTLIDNAFNFHWLSMHYTKGTFFSIQNGNRTSRELTKKKEMVIKHFFCFGNYEINRYLQHGRTVINSYPIGSFKLGIYDKYYKIQCNKKYDIAIISQFRTGIHLSDSTKRDIADRREATAILHKLLSRYINETSIKAAIFTTGNDEREVSYLKNYYRSNVDIIINDNQMLTSYSALDMSEIVVSGWSTLLYEAFGYGKKILAIDFTNSNDWNDFEEVIVIKDPSYNELKNRLNNLLEEPIEDYRKRTREYAAYIMNYDPLCPPHVFIRDQLINHL